MSTTSDTQLVEAARSGDNAAYGLLFERYEKRIYSYAYGIAGNAEDARDISQEAFMRVFEAIPAKTGELNFSAYLYRTAHNIAIDELKQRGRFAPPDALDLEAEPALRADPERVTLLREQQEQTWRATFELSDNHREVLTLRELHDMSYEQISNVTGMPRNTVGVLLSRARLKFKEAFRMSSVDTENIAKECESMLGLLSAYIDDELSAEERNHVQAHIDDCAFCHLALEEMSEASRSYRALLPLLPPPDIAEAVMARYGTDAPSSPVGRASQMGRGWSLASKIAATVALLLALGLAGYGTYLLDQDPPATDFGDIDRDLPPITAPTPARDKIASEPTEETDPGAPMAIVPEDEPEPAADPTATTGPATPTLVSPNDGAIISGTEITFVWRAASSESGLRYILEISEYSYDEQRYVAVQPVGPLEATSYTYATGSTGVMWRVCALDADNNESAPTEWRTLSRAVLLLPVVPEVTPPSLY